MSKMMRMGLVTFFLIFTAGVCGASEEKKEWNEKMKDMAEIIPDILVLVERPLEKEPKEHLDTLKAEVKKLSELAHNIDKERMEKGVPEDQDITVQYFTHLFQEEITRASSALDRGEYGYAKGILKSTTQYCIACHSRSQAASFPGQKNEDKRIKDLAPRQRAEYYASTRQFKRSIAEYQKVITDGAWAKQNPFLWEMAVRNALAVSTRTSGDAVEALNLVRMAKKNKECPKFFKKTLVRWEQDSLEWSKEQKKSSTPSQSDLASAMKLIEKAKKEQDYLLDSSSDLLYLRAVSLLHRYLKTPTKQEDQAKAFLQIGIAYEVLRSFDFWTLHEFYYEACVRAVPHTAQAAQCFGKYKESVLSGYAGSSGLYLPGDMKIKLQALSQLARKK